MSALPHAPWSAADYLNCERESDARHQFIAGQVVAMAGANERHNQLASTLNFLLYGQLIERDCQVFQSDMRVRTPQRTVNYFYPDVVVVCGEAHYEEARRDTLLNPTVVFEVLSPSTQDYDRGTKFTHYRTLSSLRDYVLVSQTQAQIEHYARQPDDTWVLRDLTHPDETLDLLSINCRLLLADIYRKVNLANESAE
jgi:Uma2 family endonuclease